MFIIFQTEKELFSCSTLKFEREPHTHIGMISVLYHIVYCFYVLARRMALGKWSASVLTPVWVSFLYFSLIIQQKGFRNKVDRFSDGRPI